MKDKSFASFNVSNWRRVSLLIALCLFVFSGFVVGQTNNANRKRINKSVKHSAKFLKKKRKASRKQIARVQQPKTEEEFEGDAEKREEWFMYQRTYPFDKIPDEARRRAWLSRPAESSSFSQAAAQSWRSIGPKPTTSAFMSNWNLTSGRINAVAVSPANSQIVLVGSATGGIWRSTDGGTNFVPVSDTQVDIAVGSIVFAQSDPNIVYAGMGDKASGYLGSGVLKSTDAGQTWMRVSNTTLPSPGLISQVQVDPTNPNRVYVAQYALRSGNSLFSSGFFYSTDGGVNWTRPIGGLARDLVRHPTEPMTLFLAMGRVDSGQPITTGGILKSIDGGVTWTRIYTTPTATASNIKVAVAPSNPQIIYVWTGVTGGNPRLEVTTNGGGMWTNLGSATIDIGQFSYNCYVFVHPTDPNTVYVGTRDVWQSTNGGTSFTNITKNFSVSGAYNPFQSTSHPDQHHFYISPTNPNEIYIANDGGIWKSTNGGTSFQTLNSTLGLTMFVSLALHPTDATRSYGGTQDNGSQRRTTGTGWIEFSSGDGGQCVIDPIDPTIVYSTYINTSITRWANNGTSGATQIGGTAVFNNDRVAFYPPFDGNGVNMNIYFGTYRLYISTNRGVSWTPPGGTTDLTFGTGVLSAIGVAKSDTNVIYTGASDGRVMVSTNGGANWNQITTGLPNRFITSIIVNPTNSNIAYLTVSGYDTGHVFRTTNGGTTWADISNNLPNIPVNTLLISPTNANTLYVGTDIGVYRSENDGATWAGLNDGLPPTIVTELVAQQSGLIQASTYGRGAYELTTTGKPIADFDGDSKTDLSIFRPSNGQWWYQQSSDNMVKALTFGSSTDRITPGDYDGDGKSDVAFWRPSTGEWFVLRSSNLTFFAAPFGTNGDTPTPADFDGDTRTDLAVYRSSQATWYILKSSGGIQTVPFGLATDIPQPADYDGDGKADVCIFRPTGGSGGGEWWMLRSSNNTVFATPFGSASDKPVPGDYTGDGKADIAFYRPTTSGWYVLRSENLTFYAAPFGTNGDIPVTGDYDGDGKYDLAVFRPSSVTWFVLKSTGGTQIQSFGTTGDKPVPSAFVP
jgi:photosystem II stability/assembly factor-like uncharacterized protein